MPGGRKRLAQAPDMNIHGALLDEHMLAPHLVEQARTGEDPAGMRHEEVEEAQLGRPEIDRLVGGAHLVRRRVDAQAGDLDDVVGELRRATAHDCFYPGQ